MTKKDYELIATEIRLDLIKYREHQEEQGYIDRYRALWEMAHRLVGAFKEENPKFDRTKFLQTCGIDN